MTGWLMNEWVVEGVVILLYEWMEVMCCLII